MEGEGESKEPVLSACLHDDDDDDDRFFVPEIFEIKQNNKDTDILFFLLLSILTSHLTQFYLILAFYSFLCLFCFYIHLLQIGFVGVVLFVRRTAFLKIKQAHVLGFIFIFYIAFSLHSMG